MFDDSIKLIEMPELNSISVCLYCENGDLFALGERINARHEQAYMNGYNWDALIRFYIGRTDPTLMADISSDPEAGMYSAYMAYSPGNLATMKRFESHLRVLLSDEEQLIAFVDENCDEIEWD